MPPNPTVNIPQQALPLGMNLWCFDAPPSDGKPVEIVIRDFAFVPEGFAGAAGRAGRRGERQRRRERQRWGERQRRRERQRWPKR